MNNNINKLWITGDGVIVHVIGMSNSHINNCINCIHDKKFNIHWLNNHGEQWLLIFEEELIRRKNNET